MNFIIKGIYYLLYSIFTVILKNMKIVILLSLLVCSFISAYAHDPVYRFPKQQNGTIKLLSASNKKFIITREYLFQIKNNKVVKSINLSFVCNDATVLNDDIVMASDSGMITYSVSKNTFKPYLRELWNKKIEYILTDAHSQLWFSSINEGAFFINHDSISNVRIEAPVVYCIAATPDNNIWIGTNVGLYKILPGSLQSERYAEEGIEGYSIPDNLVERLYPDSDSNVWAQLSETLVFISPNLQNGDAEAFDYIGFKENKVLDVAKLGALKGGYLFATSRGIVFVNHIEAFENQPAEEIHSAFEQKGVLVNAGAVRKPKEWKDLIIKNIYSDKHFTWFMTEKGVWKVKNKILLAHLRLSN